MYLTKQTASPRKEGVSEDEVVILEDASGVTLEDTCIDTTYDEHSSVQKSTGHDTEEKNMSKQTKQK